MNKNISNGRVSGLLMSYCVFVAACGGEPLASDSVDGESHALSTASAGAGAAEVSQEQEGEPVDPGQIGKIERSVTPADSSTQSARPCYFDTAQRKEFICSTDPAVFRYSNGTYEVFLVGTDRAVWHSWQARAGGSWTSWQSLGGKAVDGVWFHDNKPTIQVEGTDNKPWCNRRNPPWSGWHKC